MKNKLTVATFIGLILGIALGLWFPQFADKIDFIGKFYITFLKYMVVPVVFTTIAVSIYESRDFKGSLVSSTVALFIVMFVLTFLLSSVLIVLINPGSGFTMELSHWTGHTTQIGIGGVLLNLLPQNLQKFLTGGYLFFVIVLAAIVGYIFALSKSGSAAMEIIKKIKNFLFKVLEYFMYITPFAVCSLLSNTVAKYGAIYLGLGAKYIATAYICSLVATVVVMILPVLYFAKISFATFLAKVHKIWIITVSTCSSAATLPYTIKICREEFGIPDKITDVVVPLGCTIHMCGGAVSFSLLGLFCAQIFGVEITFGKYLLMLISALLINMAAPGIPNGGIVIGATYLEILGVPLDFIGFYSGIYKLLDMVYTTLNVTGDVTANVIIAKQVSGGKI